MSLPPYPNILTIAKTYVSHKTLICCWDSLPQTGSTHKSIFSN